MLQQKHFEMETLRQQVQWILTEYLGVFLLVSPFQLSPQAAGPVAVTHPIPPSKSRKVTPLYAYTMYSYS